MKRGLKKALKEGMFTFILLKDRDYYLEAFKFNEGLFECFKTYLNIANKSKGQLINFNKFYKQLLQEAKNSKIDKIKIYNKNHDLIYIHYS